MDTPEVIVRDCVRRALAEDLDDAALDVEADITSRLVIPALRRGRARLVAKSSGTLAGMDCAIVAFRVLDPGVSVAGVHQDGHRFVPGDLLLQCEGDMRALLAAERTALNFLQRLSGVATRTRAFVDAVAGTGARILDTRKTTPGLRLLEKRAVVAGGGTNHRFGLFDQVLLKENHFGFGRPAGYEEIVRRCVTAQDKPVVSEARNQEEAVAAVRGGAAIVLLDNFEPGPAMKETVAVIRSAARAAGRQVLIEVSGGVDLANVRKFAETGVDRISIGALTHSAPASDISMLVEGVA